MEIQEQKSFSDIENLAKLLDNQFSFLGFRFGINFFIDLVPGIGDVVSTAVCLYIFSLALKYNIPKRKIYRMLFNIAFYFVVSVIPLIGDVIGAWWKPNMRNVKLLRSVLENTY